MDILGKALCTYLCFHVVSICGGKQQADEMGCRREVRELCRTNPCVALLGGKTTAWFGTGVLGAGSKLSRAVNEGVMWSKSLKMLLKPATLARGLTGEDGSFPAGVASLVSVPSAPSCGAAASSPCLSQCLSK